MKNEFEMLELGNLTYFSGMEFGNIKFSVFLHQKKYKEDILKKSKMKNCSSAHKDKYKVEERQK